MPAAQAGCKGVLLDFVFTHNHHLQQLQQLKLVVLKLLLNKMERNFKIQLSEHA